MCPIAVTNYAKKHNMVYEYNGKDINISPSYKQQLCAYSKRQFDPFCRRTRIVFPMPDPRPCPTPPACAIAPQTSCNIDISFPEEARLPRNFNPGPDVVVHNLITTTGQLNFFRWAITSGIIDYAVENRELIEQDMNESSKTRPKHTRSSSAAVKERNAALKPMGAGVVKKAISKRNVRIVMSFN